MKSVRSITLLNKKKSVKQEETKMDQNNKKDVEITKAIVNLVSIRNSCFVFFFSFSFQIAVVYTLSKRSSNAETYCVNSYRMPINYSALV